MSGTAPGIQLRPVERVVLRLADAGVTTPDIAWRLRRTPGYVERVKALAAVPRTGDMASRDGDPLRPLERVVLRARADGVDLPEIAARHRRTPAFVERILGLAQLKLDRDANGGDRT